MRKLCGVCILFFIAGCNFDGYIFGDDTESDKNSGELTDTNNVVPQSDSDGFPSDMETVSDTVTASDTETAFDTETASDTETAFDTETVSENEKCDGCLIEGECVPHNSAQPGNVCQYCNANLKKTGWTNAPASTACDDGQWCNGTDTCRGGECTHEFSGNTRCDGINGDCALESCDEQRNSCYKPASVVCDTYEEKRCSNTDCGGAVETGRFNQYCSGSSGDCNGDVEENWEIETSCGADETCVASNGNYACEETLGCGTTWCDPNGDLCWMTNATPYEEFVTSLPYHSFAVQYCDELYLGGSYDWRLPTIHELIGLSRGCDGFWGQATGSAFDHSTCQVADDLTVTNCEQCPEGDGPTNGCYSVGDINACDVASNISSTGSGDAFYRFVFSGGYAYSTYYFGAVRCVMEQH